MELRERTNGEKAAYLQGYAAALNVAVAGLVKIAESTEFTTAQLQQQVAVLLALAASEQST